MKKILDLEKKAILFIVLLLMPIAANADKVEIDGINYELNESDHTASVASRKNKYTGDIVIPTTIEYNEIAYNVTSIGNNAFLGCTGLTNIKIPNSVIAIGESAFEGCSKISSIVIPNKVTVIESRVFDGCTNLVDVSFPSGVTEIGYGAFMGCTSLLSIVIPQGVRTIGMRAFDYCIKLTNITLPNYPTVIGDEAFGRCESLKQIEIPAGITNIPSTAFQGCKNLTKLIIADSENELTFVRSYGKTGTWGISDCPLDSIYIGRNIKARYDSDYFDGLHYSPFYGKETLTSVKFGNNVTEINRDAFANCTGLINVTIPESVSSIGYCAFEGCTGLSTIYIPNSVKRIAERAFSGCKDLQTITIPRQLETIEGYVFYGCEGLTSVVIPSSVNSIGERAFYGCTKLSNLKFEDGTIPLYITGGDYAAFYSNPITSFYLGRNLSNDYNLFNVYSITTPFDLTVSKTVTHLEGGLFLGLNIKELTFEEGDETLLISYESLLSSPTFDKTIIDSIYLGRTVICKKTRLSSSSSFVPFDGSTYSMRIGNNIKTIGDYAFSGWKIDTLYIPKNVEKIGSSPFQNCSYLNNVFIEDGDNILEFNEEIGFYGSQLNNLYLGRNISYPEGCSPFQRNKEGLKSLTIGKSVTEIGESQFAGCVNLNQLAFPASLKKIGEQAFYGCEGLDTLNIPANISEIGKDAFNLCRGLTFVNLEDSDEPLTIDNNFMNCELKKVYFGRNVIYPDHSSPFSSLEYLDSLIIGSKVTAIGNAAFADCSNLKDVVSYSEMVPETEQYAFTQSYLPSASLLVPYKLYDQYCTTTPWSLFGRIKNFEGLYNLIYVVDGEVYKKDVVKQGTAIVAEDAPTKEGYTFSGWSSIPETMPANDVTITGSFTVNIYKVTYIIDGEVFATDFVEYGATIVPPTVSEKEGFTFDGWTGVPDTMPANDVTITGSFTVNKYKVTYIIDGEVFATDFVEYGATIVPPIVSEKEGFTFDGWTGVPDTMPANDVTITGSFTVNKYKVTYIIDGEVFATDFVEYGATIVPPIVSEKEGFTFDGWSDIPETMPAHDITIYGSYTSGITEIKMDSANVRIYNINGKRINKLQRGINIIIGKDGKVRKVNIK